MQHAQISARLVRVMLESDEEVCPIPNQTQITRNLVGHSEQMQVVSEQQDVKV